MNSTVRIHHWNGSAYLHATHTSKSENLTHWSCGTIPILSGVTERGVFGEMGLE